MAPISRLSGFRDNETGDARANVHCAVTLPPTFVNLASIGSLATHQILAQLVNRILRYGDGGRVHVRTCRDAPPQPRLVESTYLVTPNPRHPLRQHAPRAPVGTDIIRHWSHTRQEGWGCPSKKTACQSGLRFQRYKPLKSVTTAGRSYLDF